MLGVVICLHSFLLLYSREASSSLPAFHIVSPDTAAAWAPVYPPNTVGEAQWLLTSDWHLDKHWATVDPDC